VHRLVGDRRDRARVADGEARVLGERGQDVALGGAVAAAGAGGRDDDAADRAAVLVDRRRHRAGHADVAEVDRAVGRAGMVLDDDEAVLGEGAAGGALAGATVGERGAVGGREASRGGEREDVRVGRVGEQHGGHLVAEELLRGADDRLEDLGQRRAVGDRALDRREVLEEPLAAAEVRGERVGGRPRRAPGRDAPGETRRRVEHRGGGGEQERLVRVERPRAGDADVAALDGGRHAQVGRWRPVAPAGGRDDRSMADDDTAVGARRGDDRGQPRDERGRLVLRPRRRRRRPRAGCAPGRGRPELSADAAWTTVIGRR
jgi:hypothetical protein